MTNHKSHSCGCCMSDLNGNDNQKNYPMPGRKGRQGGKRHKVQRFERCLLSGGAGEVLYGGGSG